jgi:hypothetical protein
MRGCVGEAKMLIERWRQHYNTIRPRSSLGCRPPAPEAVVVPTKAAGCASLGEKASPHPPPEIDRNAVGLLFEVVP